MDVNEHTAQFRNQWRALQIRQWTYVEI